MFLFIFLSEYQNVMIPTLFCTLERDWTLRSLRETVILPKPPFGGGHFTSSATDIAVCIPSKDSI